VQINFSANQHNQSWPAGMGLDFRKGAGPQTSYGTWSLPHIVAMVTIVVMFSVKHVLNLQLSMDRPQQLSIRQKNQYVLVTSGYLLQE